MFSHIPGLKGVAPSDPYTAKGLLTAAIRDDDPVVYFEHKGLYGMTGHVPEEPYELPIGKARTVREGSDITLVGISKMTWVCTEAAAELAKSGINAEVVDLLSISPIDYDHVIDSVRRTHRLVVVDEDTPICSLASEICSRVAEEAFDYLDAPPSRVTAPHTPRPLQPPAGKHLHPQRSASYQNGARPFRQGLVTIDCRHRLSLTATPQLTAYHIVYTICVRHMSGTSQSGFPILKLMVWTFRKWRRALIGTPLS